MNLELLKALEKKDGKKRIKYPEINPRGLCYWVAFQQLRSGSSSHSNFSVDGKNNISLYNKISVTDIINYCNALCLENVGDYIYFILTLDNVWFGEMTNG